MQNTHMHMLQHRNSLFFPLASAFLLTLALPWVGLTFFAWVALVPLLLFVSDERVSRSKLFFGTAIALLAYMLAVAYPLMHIEGAWWAGTHELDRYLSESIQFTGGMVLAACWRVLFFLFFIPVARYGATKRYGALLLAVLWVLIEWAYATLGLWGYSAGVIGYSLIDSAYEKHAAYIGGVYLLSFIVVLTNVVIAQVLLLQLKQQKKLFLNAPMLVPTFLFLAIVLCYGFFAERPSDKDATYLRVAVIGSVLSTEASVTEAGYRSYRKKLTEAFQHEPDLIVLPENVFPYFELREEDSTLVENTLVNFPNRNALYADLTMLSRTHSATTIALGIHTTKNGKVYNSVVFIKNGTPLGYYQKRVLVPFTEYAPFGLPIPLAVRFSKGANEQYFNVGGVKASALVCSEIADTNIRMSNTSIIIAPSNDSVFEGEYAAPMHTSMARMRAVEQRAYVLRANKGGSSSIIDPNGTVLAETLDGVIFATLSLSQKN